MPVYVDELVKHPSPKDPATLQAGAKYEHRWCHLMCDPGELESLHRIAREAGMRHQWFQAPPKASLPHYDLVPPRREAALAAGAVALDRAGLRDFFARWKAHRAEARAQRFAPPDLLAANTLWSANCGPGALAAVMGVPLAQVRAAFPRFPRQAWTNPTQMQTALTSLACWTTRALGMPSPSSRRGLLYIQLRGRWDNAPERVQYQHTHWVAFARGEGGLDIYDVNAGDAGGWLPSESWKQQVLADITGRREGASGSWYVRTSFEVHV